MMQEHSIHPEVEVTKGNLGPPTLFTIRHRRAIESFQTPFSGRSPRQNLAELKQIKRLSLAGGGISDASLAHVAGLAGLETLNVRKTKVTASGLAELPKALPACQ